MVELTVNVHEYIDHVLVEVVTDEGGGDVTAHSLEFDVVAADAGEIMPCEALPADYEAEVRLQLDEAGYTVVRAARA